MIEQLYIFHNIIVFFILIKSHSILVNHCLKKLISNYLLMIPTILPGRLIRQSSFTFTSLSVRRTKYPYFYPNAVASIEKERVSPNTLSTLTHTQTIV